MSIESISDKADNLEHFGNKLIQARTFAELALVVRDKPLSRCEVEERAETVEHYARKAYRLGEQVIDFIQEVL